MITKLRLLLFFAIAGCCASGVAMANTLKPRVIITTDINVGEGDPDDRQSLCHLLWYAYELDIRAIIPDRFSKTATEACNMAFDLHEQDFNRPGSKFKERGYPSPDCFRQQALVNSRAAAIKRIVDEAKRDDPRPLWVLVWGTMSLIGEALKQSPDIAPKIRLITIATFLRAKDNGGDAFLQSASPARPEYGGDRKERRSNAV